MAGERRRRDPEGYREDERRRQQACRERRGASDGCHAPPSARKSPSLEGQIGRIVARALEASRATLIREIRVIVEGSGAERGTAKAGVTQEPRSASG